MAEVRTYDANEVNLVVGGRVITGPAEDTWITVERNEDSFEPVVGAKGEVTYSESNDRTGVVKITLDGTSPSVAYLYELSRRKGNRALVDVSIVDANVEGGMRWSGIGCRVKRPANWEGGKEVGEREFEIFVADLGFDV